jgi:hypothetical protein
MGLVLILGGVLLGCVILEITMRLLPLPTKAGGGYMGFSSRYMCSPTTGWTVRPNFQEFVTGPEYSLPLRFNSAGLHDTDHTFEKADNVFRILLVGDSFVQAAQVQEVQTAHQQLEDILNEKLGNSERMFEVINAGVSAWGASQELVYYREQGWLYQSDLVLLLFYIGNDIENNLPGHAVTVNGFNCFAPYFPLCDGKLDPEPWYYIPGLDPAWDSCSPAYRWLTSALAYFQQNSYLFARIEPLLLSLKERRMYGQGFGYPHTALYLPNESEELRYGWQVTKALLAQFNEEVEVDGTEFAVAVVGPYQAISLSQYNETQLQTLYQSEPYLREAKVDQPNRRLLSFLQTQNIPAVDLQQPMIDHGAATGARLYFPLDGHWTVEGNRLAAEIIAYWLIGQELVPITP